MAIPHFATEKDAEHDSFIIRCSSRRDGISTETGWNPMALKDGAKVFTQTLRAQNENVKAIPPITFAYFDSGLGKYREAVSRPIPIHVKSTRVVTAADIQGGVEHHLARNELEGWSQGIAHTYEGPDVLENRRFRISSAAGSPFWLAGLILPLAGFLVLSFVCPRAQ